MVNEPRGRRLDLRLHSTAQAHNTCTDEIEDGLQSRSLKSRESRGPEAAKAGSLIKVLLDFVPRLFDSRSVSPTGILTLHN